MKKLSYLLSFLFLFTFSLNAATSAGIVTDNPVLLAMSDMPEDIEPYEPPEVPEEALLPDQPQPPQADQPQPPQPSAQPAPIEQPQPEAAVPITPAPRPRPVVQEKTPGNVVTKNQIEESGGVFNFDDADVYSVIQTVFGDILKVNYIIDQSIKGRVNFRSVAPVAKKDILPLMEVILRLNGIGIVEAEGLYRIVPISDLPKEPTPVGFGRDVEQILIEGKALVQIVPVKYVQSSELMRVLFQFLSKSALIVDVPKSNHIVIVDTDANVKRLLKLVAIFDSEELRQIKPQVFVYPVQNSLAKDVADILKQIFLGAKESKSAPQIPVTTKSGDKKAPVRQPVVTGLPRGVSTYVSEDTRIFPDERSNSIIILATPEDYALISEAIKHIDIVPRQVMIEAVVAEITLGDDMEFGIAWSLKTDLEVGNVINLDGEHSFNPGLDLTTLAGFAFAGVDSSGIVRALLETLATEDRANVISAPHILVSDNREATIQIGDQVPIATSETNISGSTQIQRTIQYRDTGTILKVKPQVNEGGLVSLDITQEVSDFRTVNIFDSEQVVINKRVATTNLVVQDNQTIVIGGLIRDKTEKTKSGIPFLSKIPVLGYLFGKTDDKYDRIELVILLTPHVIRSQAEANNVSTHYIDRIEEVQKNIDKLKMKLGVEKEIPRSEHPHNE